MAITIVTTVAAANANSYVTVLEATAYFEAIPAFSTTWLALNAEAQKAALVNAARSLDRIGWRGQKYSTTQALEFPRMIGSVDPVRQSTWDYSTIPQEIKDAQCEMVILLQTTAASANGAAPGGAASAFGLGRGALNLTLKSPSREEKEIYNANLSAIKARCRFWLGGSNNVRWEK